MMLLEILVAVLLVAVLGFGFVLNRRLAALRAPEQNLRDLASAVGRAAEQARLSLADLKAASQDLGPGLQERLDRARAMIDELEFLNKAADRAAARLAGRLGGEAPGAAPTAPPIQVGSQQSEVERDLAHALRRVK